MYFEVNGTKGAFLSEQLRNYHREFQALFPNLRAERPKTWGEAFYQLKEAVDTIDTTQKIIIFIDELPCLASPKSGWH